MIHDPDAFYGRLAARGLIGVGESYQAADWDCDDLPALLTQVFSASDGKLPSAVRRLRRWVGSHRFELNRNSMAEARRNISFHYDLSNDLFSSFLDESMTYSAALFPTDDSDQPLATHDALPEAQARKIDRLLDLTGVRDGTRLLEIGTGWGALAIRAATRGARVHTVTISQEQLEYTRGRIRDAGLGNRITAEFRDYRELDRATHTYDAIISVEMIEAIGERNWPGYFSLLADLVAPGGRIGLQVITMRHDRFLVVRRAPSWVNLYVLPGFLLPSVPALEASLHRHTDLRVLDRMAFGQHYAETLRLWRERFDGHSDDIRALGFDETFRRTWSLFLASSEAGFRARHFDVYHYLLGRA